MILVKGRYDACGLENWFIVFVGVAIAGLIGLFLYGWRRRKEEPPPGVKPLKDDDDDWGR